MSGMAVVGSPIGTSVKGGEGSGRFDIFLRVKSDEEGRRVRCCMQMQKNSFLFLFLSFSAPQIQEEQKPRTKCTNGFVLKMFFFLI